MRIMVKGRSADLCHASTQTTRRQAKYTLRRCSPCNSKMVGSDGFAICKNLRFAMVKPKSALYNRTLDSKLREQRLYMHVHTTSNTWPMHKRSFSWQMWRVSTTTKNAWIIPNNQYGGPPRLLKPQQGRRRAKAELTGTRHGIFGL